jgi:hypothetical protein
MPLCSKRIGTAEEPILAVTKGIPRVQLSHDDPVRFARFEDSSLVSAAGLVPAVALGPRAGLGELARTHLSVPGGPCAAGVKVSALVAGMVCGADSIDEDRQDREVSAAGEVLVGARVQQRGELKCSTAL